MATMKKATKAAAVAKGTYHECAWCGKEGDDFTHTSTSSKVVCGRAVTLGKAYYCSAECCHIETVETNRRNILERLDWINGVIDNFKKFLTEAVARGVQVPPTTMRIAKIAHILKKVLTLIMTGDKPSAQKVYDENKATITDCEEDILASSPHKASEVYMVFIDSFAGVETMLKPSTSV